jgi:hypothetical protein
VAASERSWSYYDIREPKNQFVLQSNPNRSAWLDVGGAAEFCGLDDAYQCFMAGDFQFAVPKGFSGKEEKWDYRGISYKVAGTSRRQILGQKYVVYFVERNLGSHRLRFLFTREVGLIAIATIGEAQGMLLLLSEKCGYGAPSRCYGPP